jgi:putative hydrolase of the HAD superfamily
MRITTIFFDLDETLYPPASGLWEAIKARMHDYMRLRMNIPADEIPRLRERYFLQYGTTLRGLQAHHRVDTGDYLAYVHDLPLEDYLVPDPRQRAVIASLPTRNLIFTNADESHARRTLRVLGLEDLFPLILDVNAIAPYCKPMPQSFSIAMQAAGETDPACCAMIDDLAGTTRAARAAGMSGILCGRAPANGDADAAFTDWSELPRLLERL